MQQLLTPANQAKLFAGVLTWLVVCGICASILMLFGLIWLIIQACSVLVRSAIEALQLASMAVSQAHPFIQLLLLVGVGFGAFCFVRWRLR